MRVTLSEALSAMIRLRTLGPLELTGPPGANAGSVLAQPKRAALLVYLVMTVPQGYRRRDELLALFWPELDTAHARTSLRQALRFLRRSLGDGIVLTRGDDVSAAPDHVWCDAHAFEEALAAGDERQALSLYAGDFLTGFHASASHEMDEWIDRQRLRLRERASQAAWTLAERNEADENPVGAVYWARQAAMWSPEGELALRRLMELLSRTGDITGAIRAYQEYGRRLQTEYGIVPSEETRALMQAILGRNQPSVDGPDRVT
jgi:DNA-binding SARP family transcriptional activator